MAVTDANKVIAESEAKAKTATTTKKTTASTTKKTATAPKTEAPKAEAKTEAPAVAENANVAGEEEIGFMSKYVRPVAVLVSDHVKYTDSATKEKRLAVIGMGYELAKDAPRAVQVTRWNPDQTLPLKRAKETSIEEGSHRVIEWKPGQVLVANNQELGFLGVSPEFGERLGENVFDENGKLVGKPTAINVSFGYLNRGSKKEGEATATATAVPEEQLVGVSLTPTLRRSEDTDITSVDAMAPQVHLYKVDFATGTGGRKLVKDVTPDMDALRKLSTVEDAGFDPVKLFKPYENIGRKASTKGKSASKSRKGLSEKGALFQTQVTNMFAKHNVKVK